MPEPTLSEVHADLVGRFHHDDRLRKVEQEVAALRELPQNMQRMEDRLINAISASKVNLWPAVSGIVAIIAVVLVIAGAIYGTNT